MSEAWKDDLEIVKSKPLIAICLPYNASMLHMQFMRDTYEPLKYAKVPWCNTTVITSKVPNIPHARNALAKLALDVNADYVFFIDGDIIFENMHPLDGLKILYDIQKPITAGLYRAKKKEGFDYAMWVKDKNIQTGWATVVKPPMEEHAVWQVDATGLGCCLINTEVFKKTTPPWFVWNMPGDISEDFYFFDRTTRELGDAYAPWIASDVKLSHLATVAIRSDGKVQMPTA